MSSAKFLPLKDFTICVFPFETVKLTHPHKLRLESSMLHLAVSTMNPFLHLYFWHALDMGLKTLQSKAGIEEKSLTVCVRMCINNRCVCAGMCACVLCTFSCNNIHAFGFEVTPLWQLNSSIHSASYSRATVLGRGCENMCGRTQRSKRENQPS